MQADKDRNKEKISTLPKFSWSRQCGLSHRTDHMSWITRSCYTSKSLLICKEYGLGEDTHTKAPIVMKFWTQDTMVTTLPSSMWARHWLSKDSMGFKKRTTRKGSATTSPMTHEEGMLARDSHLRARIMNENWAQKDTLTNKSHHWTLEKMQYLASNFYSSSICRFITHENALFHAKHIIISRQKIIKKKSQHGKIRSFTNCGHFCNVIPYCIGHFLVHYVISILSLLRKTDNREYAISLGRQLHFVDSLTLCFILFYIYKN